MTDQEREHLQKIINDRADAYINQDPDDAQDADPDPEREYFAYRHISGHIHVRRYSAASLADAEESDFVDACTGRYVARNRAHAEAIALENLARHLLG